MKYLIILVLSFTLTSCTSWDDATVIPSGDELVLPKEYSYVLTNSCYCLPAHIGPHFLHIRDNQIIDYRLLNDGEMFRDSDNEAFTIYALVTYVNDRLAQNPVEQEIKMHRSFNFPVKVFLRMSNDISDTEWGYEITNFNVIKK